MCKKLSSGTYQLKIRGRDWSGNRKNKLTVTHFLKRTEARADQDIERRESARGTHSLEETDIGTGQATDKRCLRVILTSWRGNRSGLVAIYEEIESAKRTYFL